MRKPIYFGVVAVQVRGGGRRISNATYLCFLFFADIGTDICQIIAVRRNSAEKEQKKKSVTMWSCRKKERFFLYT